MNKNVRYTSCTECCRRTICLSVESDDPYIGVDICMECVCSAFEVSVPVEHMARLTELAQRRETIVSTHGRQTYPEGYDADLRRVMGWPSKEEEAAALKASRKHTKCARHQPFFSTEGRQMACPTCGCECTECTVGRV